MRRSFCSFSKWMGASAWACVRIPSDRFMAVTERGALRTMFCNSDTIRVVLSVRGHEGTSTHLSEVLRVLCDDRRVADVVDDAVVKRALCSEHVALR